MDSTAARLLRHIDTYDKLKKMRGKGDLIAAGLSITLCVGTMDGEFSAPVETAVVDNMFEIIDAVIDGLEKTMQGTAHFTKKDRDEAQHAMEAYERFQARTKKPEPK